VVAEPHALIYACVPNGGQKSLQGALPILTGEQRSRLVALEADPTAIDLGLSGKEYRELAEQVDRIHHAAQLTRLGASRALAEAVNVRGMREVVELGRACKNIRSIVVHSSACVSGNRTGRVLERELNAGQSFRSVTEETLACAERTAQSAMKELPITVVRPSQIVGDSHTGEIDELDGPYPFIQLMLGLPEDLSPPLPTRGDEILHLAPIDFVVRAAHHIGMQPSALGRTFHLTDPEPPSVRQALQLVAKHSGKRVREASLPSNLTQAFLKAPVIRRLSAEQRAYLELVRTSVRYDTTNADEILGPAGIVCPSFESYVGSLVRYLRARAQGRLQSGAEEFEDHSA
jgi:thioester reductase-like protein